MVDDAFCSLIAKYIAIWCDKWRIYYQSAGYFCPSLGLPFTYWLLSTVADIVFRTHALGLPLLRVARLSLPFCRPRLLLVLLFLGRRRLLSAVHNIDYTTITRPLQLCCDHNAPRLLAHRLEPPFLAQPPNIRQIDSIPRSSAAYGRLRFRANKQPSPPTCTDQLRDITDQIPPCCAIPHHPLTVAYLQPLPAPHGFGQGLELEKERLPHASWKLRSSTGLTASISYALTRRLISNFFGRSLYGSGSELSHCIPALPETSEFAVGACRPATMVC
ncbi:hypothetical protein KC320_g264 [Hortaea werneckii]|nr:hypothetical protein KC320_g264 [Hortaea werneckii]